MATYTGGKNNEKNYAAPTITFKGKEKAKPQTLMRLWRQVRFMSLNQKKEQKDLQLALEKR